jgi:hypothetical protein
MLAGVMLWCYFLPGGLIARFWASPAAVEQSVKPADIHGPVAKDCGMKNDQCNPHSCVRVDREQQQDGGTRT